MEWTRLRLAITCAAICGGEGWHRRRLRLAAIMDLSGSDAERLISLIRPENLPSRRVAEKVGLSLWKEVMWRDLPHCVYVIRNVCVP